MALLQNDFNPRQLAEDSLSKKKEVLRLIKSRYDLFEEIRKNPKEDNARKLLSDIAGIDNQIREHLTR